MVVIFHNDFIGTIKNETIKVSKWYKPNIYFPALSYGSLLVSIKKNAKFLFIVNQTSVISRASNITMGFSDYPSTILNKKY